MFKPVGDRVAVQPMKREETTASGIVLPDSAMEKPQEGTVVAVGKHRNTKGDLVDLSVKVGDHVVFGKFAGTEIKYDGEIYLIMREDDILAVIE